MSVGPRRHLSIATRVWPNNNFRQRRIEIDPREGGLCRLQLRLITQTNRPAVSATRHNRPSSAGSADQPGAGESSPRHMQRPGSDRQSRVSAKPLLRGQLASILRSRICRSASSDSPHAASSVGKSRRVGPVRMQSAKACKSWIDSILRRCSGKRRSASAA